MLYYINQFLFRSGNFDSTLRAALSLCGLGWVHNMDFYFVQPAIVRAVGISSRRGMQCSLLCLLSAYKTVNDGPDLSFSNEFHLMDANSHGRKPVYKASTKSFARSLPVIMLCRDTWITFSAFQHHYDYEPVHGLCTPRLDVTFSWLRYCWNRSN